MKRDKGFLKGALLGGIIGTVSALLLAPKSGKETQDDIKRRARMVKRDIDQMILDLQDDLGGRIDNLKDVAKDLKGEAWVESQDLIKKAELLKRDLQSSASNLTKVGSQAKGDVVDNAKRLVNEGTAVMNELERVTKKMVVSARDKVRNNHSTEDSATTNDRS